MELSANFERLIVSLFKYEMKEYMSIEKIEKVSNNEKIINSLYGQIEEIILTNKKKIIYQINDTLVNTYFNIGKTIVQNEQNGNIRTEYGKEILIGLYRRLVKKHGTGFSRTNFQNMRLFYERYKNCQPVAGNLSWSS